MSTDKTLADVKPGGRVRLGYGLAVESRARELLAHEYAMSGSTKRADKIIAGFDCAPATEYAVRAIVAALSAQPSPGETLPPEMRLGSPDYLDYLDTEPSTGGQDALLGYVRVEAIKALREDDEVTGVMVHVEERTNSVPVYLAARQPVGK